MRDRIWVTRDDRRYLVSQMQTSHIINAIRMIQRSVMIGKPWRVQYLQRLELELFIRSLKGK